MNITDSPRDTRLPARRSERLLSAAHASVIAIVALALGGLTDLAQSWLPHAVGSLANSTGSWVVIVLLLSLSCRSRVAGAVCGATTLLALVVGYYSAAGLRDVPISITSVMFWALAAIVVGPVVGIAAVAMKYDRPWSAGAATGVVSGLLTGESIYGLRDLASSTAGGYWIGQAVVAALLVVLVAWCRGRAVVLAAASVTGCAVAIAIASVL